ncbi:hypothetical protein GN244_ATG15011 [Phytophthora infestans]|uniref:Transmembrane protein n=1 Tax=Phytophthora infestans TaxID=4787 RepID=A0A833VXS6_PHYIN|nr:hypothetical protein GN244_ATG15011 [Phytophthora infestans]KAF4140207.1 hypothetical protein GN958_ATG10602 [Phytophthora infestans]
MLRNSAVADIIVDAIPIQREKQSAYCMGRLGIVLAELKALLLELLFMASFIGVPIFFHVKITPVLDHSFKRAINAFLASLPTCNRILAIHSSNKYDSYLRRRPVVLLSSFTVVLPFFLFLVVHQFRKVPRHRSQS